ncbi:MAG: hypothetical protein FWG57_08980 [Endomicrobia bacterium]|nr:hypothetical protein [Bacillota bacterium]MCL1973097.1 hypothetical protein [Endomicrobiia bacterium]
MNTGKTIIPYGVFPELHELETARFFNKLGKDVEFLVPSYTKNSKTPDIKMDNILWEMKAPKGGSNRTIENNLRAALKQSANLILDLRRIKLNERKALFQINRAFKLSKKIIRVLVVKKNKSLLDIKR